jgi:hypothetical protein
MIIRTGEKERRIRELEDFIKDNYGQYQDPYFRITLAGEIELTNKGTMVGIIGEIGNISD